MANHTGVVLSAAAMVAVLTILVGLEGRRYIPYTDVAGVLTVCSGITGPAINRYHVYTPKECDALERNAVLEHFAGIAKCIKVPLQDRHRIAFALMSYNIGVAAFCGSTLVKKLNAGDYTGACEQIRRWKYIRRHGLLVDCSVPAYECAGIPKRREQEAQICLGV